MTQIELKRDHVEKCQKLWHEVVIALAGCTAQVSCDDALRWANKLTDDYDRRFNPDKQ